MSGYHREIVVVLDAGVRTAMHRLDRLRADICTASGLSWDQFAFAEDIDTIIAGLGDSRTAAQEVREKQN